MEIDETDYRLESAAYDYADDLRGAPWYDEDIKNAFVAGAAWAQRQQARERLKCETCRFYVRDPAGFDSCLNDTRYEALETRGTVSDFGCVLHENKLD